MAGFQDIYMPMNKSISTTTLSIRPTKLSEAPLPGSGQGYLRRRIRSRGNP